MSNILFITVSYPYGTGEQFVASEIEYLSNKTDRITIYPAKISGEARPLPDNVDVVRQSSLIRCLTMLFGLLYIFIKYRKFLFGDLLSTLKEEKLRVVYLSRCAYIFVYLLRASQFVLWFDYRYKRHAQNAILYTYWMNAEAYALSIIKRDNPALKTVSRVHGGDLYSELNSGFLPFRTQIMKSLDRIFAISKHGKKYLVNRYGNNVKNKVIVSRLAVKAAFKLDVDQLDSCIIIASCSSDAPVKRISAIAQIMGNFSNIVTERVIWVHLGIQRNQFIKKYGNLLKTFDNLEYVIEGVVPHKLVPAVYRKHLPHLFINLSSSEGVPVSIMEALSMGIPVLATDVGGTSELIDSQVGALVHPKINPMEVIDEIHSILKSRNERSKAAFNRCNYLCNEKLNYENHYKHLKGVFID